MKQNKNKNKTVPVVETQTTPVAETQTTPVAEAQTTPVAETQPVAPIIVATYRAFHGRGGVLGSVSFVSGGRGGGNIYLPVHTLVGVPTTGDTLTLTGTDTDTPGHTLYYSHTSAANGRHHYKVPGVAGQWVIFPQQTPSREGVPCAKLHSSLALRGASPVVAAVTTAATVAAANVVTALAAGEGIVSPSQVADAAASVMPDALAH